MNPRIRSAMPRALALAVTGVALGGCVSQREYDDLYSANRSLEERNITLQQDLDASSNTVALLRERLGEADTTLNDVQTRNSTLQQDVSLLGADYETLLERLNSMSLAMIDPATDRALRQLAAANPGVLTYDSARSMLRFSSDLTFGSGSDVVTERAAETLRQLATVLNDVGGTYDLRIVGHTDSVPVSRPATRQRHPTNLHLSSHRAIGVFNVLRSAGIPAERMEVAGRGEFHPVVPNRTSGGTAENRRVEIFLVPAPTGSAGTSNIPQTVDAQDDEEPVRQPMK
jgi:flagellar motor protein MotB